MIEYDYFRGGKPRYNTTEVKMGKVAYINSITHLYATGREKEIIETNAPFLKDCHGEYQNCEAQAAALAFNFTEK
jgi:hypothetical protein